MKSFIKAGIFLFFLSISPLFSQTFKFRNILDTQFYQYSTGKTAVNVENTLLVPLSDVFILEGKGLYFKNDYMQKFLFQMGGVYLLNKNTYVEMILGPSVFNNIVVAVDGHSEIVYENSLFLMSACFRAGYVPDTTVFFIVPNASFMYKFFSFYSAKLKYYFGYSTENFYSHTFLNENIFTIFNINVVTLFISGGIEKYSAYDNYVWSIGGKYQRPLSKNILLKCNVEYKKETKGIETLNEGITVDLKF